MWAVGAGRGEKKGEREKHQEESLGRGQNAPDWVLG